MIAGFWMPRRTRPSPRKEAWRPTLDRGPDDTVHVPRRLRGLRLRRRYRARMSGTSAGAWIVIVAVLGAVAILAVRALLS